MSAVRWRRARHRAAEALHAAPIYLDNNATTRPLPEVVSLVARAMRTNWANPSSAHWLGGDARTLLESFEKTRPLDQIPVEAFLACVGLMGEPAQTAEIRLADLIQRRHSPARMFGASEEVIEELCALAKETYRHEGVEVQKLAAERYLRVPPLTPADGYGSTSDGSGCPDEEPPRSPLG